MLQHMRLRSEVSYIFSADLKDSGNWILQLPMEGKLDLDFRENKFLHPIISVS